MAGTERDPSAPVDGGLAELIGRAHRSSFFAVMEQLERHTRDSVRVGGEGPVEREAIRFRHDPNLAFSAGDISAASVREVPARAGAPARQVIDLTTTFLGLIGAVGPLPLHIADELAQDSSEAQVQRAFLDVFHHRLISLFYRSWVRHKIAHEHPSGEPDLWSLRLLALLGVDRYGRPGRAGLPTHVLLRCAPMLIQRARNGETLKVVLAAALADNLADATIDVEQFAGGWSALDADSRMRLGVANHALGRGTTLGSRVMDRAGHFLIRIGPLPHSSYAAFTDGGQALDTVDACVNLVVREPLDYEIELSLRGDETPPFCLSTSRPARLGRETWLGNANTGTRTVRIRPQQSTARTA